ncbi:hypothetical protein [Dactylosporangium sp. NPDC051484]|uniref:hypothetical protein n=1 Tax=Dactylosporangium sp. NPDC051484 TaxID=3154942 RepID=UPI00344C571D
MIVNANAIATREWLFGEPLIRSNGALHDPDQNEDIDPDWDPIGAYRQWLRRQASALPDNGPVVSTPARRTDRYQSGEAA